MNINLFEEGFHHENLGVIDPLTFQKVWCRAHELALVSGRTPAHVTTNDFEQARRELAGESTHRSGEETFFSPTQAEEINRVA